MSLAFRIALRFLKSSKGQTFLIAIGIAIGVSVQIFIGLLIQGLQQSLLDKTIGNSPQVTILSDNEDKLISNWQDILSNAKKTSDKVVYTGADLQAPAFIKAGKKSESVIIHGFDFTQKNEIYKFDEKLKEGNLPIDSYSVIVGKELKDSLDLKKDQKIDILTTDGKKVKLLISGFFDFKVAALNKTWIIVNLKTAQDITGVGDRVSSVQIKLANDQLFSADKVRKEIETNLNIEGLQFTDWKDQNAELLSGLNGQSISSYMIQVFVLISVVLGIASILAITVIQKSKQIGILKAMGIKNRTASMIFLFEGLLLGLLGAILGILFGVGLIAAFTKFALNPDGTPVVPINLNYSFISLSGLIAIIAAVLASLIPAANSSKLNPIEVIKNG